MPPLLSCASSPLPLDSIACQTVLSKLLGPLNTWRDKLEVAAKSGFNMIHFTPIQALGLSKSAYSLADQLSLNPSFSTPEVEATFNKVEELVEWMRREWGVLSICDVVLNHTANESGWLAEHPDATYNLSNCPHLRPAFLLDRCIKRLAREIGEGRWVDEGIPKGEVATAAQLEVCKRLLEEIYLPKASIPELFLCDVEAIAKEFKEEILKRPPPLSSNNPQLEKRIELVLVQDEGYHRHGCTVDIEVAIANYNISMEKVNQEEERVDACVENLKTDLLRLNSLAHAKVSAHLATALANVISGAFYQHVDPEGPQKTGVSVREDEELVAPYFTCPDLDNLEDEFELAWSEEGRLCMAHNGWVMGDDPLRDFAMPGSQVSQLFPLQMSSYSCWHPGLPAQRVGCLGGLSQAEIRLLPGRFSIPMGAHASLCPANRPDLRRPQTGQLPFHPSSRCLLHARRGAKVETEPVCVRRAVHWERGERQHLCEQAGDHQPHTRGTCSLGQS